MTAKLQALHFTLFAIILEIINQDCRQWWITIHFHGVHEYKWLWRWLVSSIVSLPSKNVDRADFNCGWDVPALTSLLKRRLYRRFVSVFNTVDEAFSRCCALRGKRSGMVMTEQKEEDGPSTYFHFVSYSFFFSFFVSFLFRTIFNIRKKIKKTDIFLTQNLGREVVTNFEPR